MKRAIEQHGTTMQTVVAMEELAELTQELSKQIRGEGSRAGLYSEIVDVYIMLSQIEIIYDIKKELVESDIDYKLDRLSERLQEEQSENQ